MPRLILLGAFDRVRRKVAKAYPFAANDISAALDAISARPEAAPVYPGFAPFTVRKQRIAMREYKIPERKGLRLVYLVAHDAVVPVHLYKKGHPPQEHQVLSEVKMQMREIVKELSNQQ